MCPLQLATIEDIKRHVCRKSFIVTYQHDDDEFVINIKINSQERVYCLHMFIYIKGKITEIIRARV